MILKKHGRFWEKLISATTDIVNTLMSMMEIALKEKRYEDAKYFTEVLEKTVKLYDLWDYNTYAGYLQLYIAQKDSDNFIAVLKNMLDSMSKSGIHQNQNYIVYKNKRK